MWKFAGWHIVSFSFKSQLMCIFSETLVKSRDIRYCHAIDYNDVFLNMQSICIISWDIEALETYATNDVKDIIHW